MPKCFSYLGYVIYFWSNEGYPLEPVHVIPAHDLKRILRVVELYSSNIITLWENYYNVSARYIDQQKE